MTDYKLVPNLRQIVAEALVGMVSGVTQMVPPADEPLPDFIQAPIDRAVTRIRSEIDLHAAAAPATVERNQCDGCQAGIPVENGMHRMGKPGRYPDLMLCTADRYTAPQPADQQPAPDVPGLTEALRQYQHNDGSGLVFGYDKLLVDQYVAGLVDALVACARASSAAEVGLIVDAALAAHRKQQEGKP